MKLSNEELLDELCSANNKYVVGIEATPEYRKILSLLEQGQKAIDRYELIRRLSPREFSDIYQLNISTGKPFDEIVDNLLPFRRKP